MKWRRQVAMLSQTGKRACTKIVQEALQYSIYARRAATTVISLFTKKVDISVAELMSDG